MNETQRHCLFATEIAGPMTFAFKGILKIKEMELSKAIQSNGGEVIEYDQRNQHTIVLTEKNEELSHEIEFDVNYIKDCLEKKKILPLETYRLDKKVTFGCIYSKPFGSEKCMYSKLIQKGTCKKHKSVPTNEIADVDSHDDVEINKILEDMKSLIYEDSKPQVNMDMSEDSSETE